MKRRGVEQERGSRRFMERRKSQNTPPLQTLSLIAV